MKNMSIIDLANLLNYVYMYHSPLSHSNIRIKYVDPHIDLRTGQCFSITFRMCGGGEAICFYTTNEFRDAEPLYNRIMQWLNSKEK